MIYPDTCRHCGRPVAVVTVTTGGRVTLDRQPVPSATAAHTVAYALLRGGVVRPLGDCHAPPPECFQQHRCPQMRDNPHWTELMRVSEALEDWERQAAGYAYPDTQTAPVSEPRRLA